MAFWEQEEKTYCVPDVSPGFWRFWTSLPVGLSCTSSQFLTLALQRRTVRGRELEHRPNLQ
jgi:hypothetical protein